MAINLGAMNVVGALLESMEANDTCVIDARVKMTTCDLLDCDPPALDRWLAEVDDAELIEWLSEYERDFSID